jgi:hypothetical protein
MVAGIYRMPDAAFRTNRWHGILDHLRVDETRYIRFGRRDFHNSRWRSRHSVDHLADHLRRLGDSRMGHAKARRQLSRHDYRRPVGT